MPKLPRVTAAEAIRALERLGFVQVRQRGSQPLLPRGDALAFGFVKSQIVLKKQIPVEGEEPQEVIEVGCVVPYSYINESA